MILGVSILDNRLLLALHHGHSKDPEFLSFHIDIELDLNSAPGESVWKAAGPEALEYYKGAEKIIYAIPSSLCFLKCLDLDSRMINDNPAYSAWLAGTLLPGELPFYKYDFLPVRESFDGSRMEMIFYAAPAKHVDHIIQALKAEDDSREIILIPEQLGLVKVVDKSLAKGDITQAGIINFESNGASTVYVKNGHFSHGRFFVIFPEKRENLPIDVETYLLSRADSTESLPLIITGLPGDFKSNWSPIVPAFLGIHHLEYAGAWGVADYDFAGTE